MNNEADIQQFLALKSFEFDLDLNGFKLSNKVENKSCANTSNCCVYVKPCGSDTLDDKPCDSDTLFDCT